MKEDKIIPELGSVRKDLEALERIVGTSASKEDIRTIVTEYNTLATEMKKMEQQMNLQREQIRGMQELIGKTG